MLVRWWWVVCVGLDTGVMKKLVENKHSDVTLSDRLTRYFNTISLTAGKETLNCIK